MTPPPAARLALILAFLGATTATQAQPLTEIYYHEGPVSSQSVDSWSSGSGSRHFLLNLGSPVSSDLEVLTDLKGLDRTDLESNQYPGEDSAPAWTSLAARGVGFVALDAGMPTPAEIARLNRIHFSRITIVLQGFPGDAEASNLQTLKAPVSLTMVTQYYPKYEDRPTFDRMPAATPLLFVTDYWPWYAHMDVFNLMKQPIRLRVNDIFPDPAELDYLHNIQRLGRIEVQTSSDPPSADVWSAFGDKPVHWLAHEWVPTAEALHAFAGAGRRLTIDQDWDLTAEQKTLLQAQPFAVEWLHQAPDRKASSTSVGRRSAPWLH